MSFEFATAGQIVFGRGALKRLPGLVREWGSLALVVTGSTTRRAETVCQLLAEGRIRTQILTCDGEPTIDQARAALVEMRRSGAQFVVGIGGGSALDLGKAVSALAANDRDPLDYLELIGTGRPITRPPLPYAAIPTTAGTGSEVTRNAVLGSPEHRSKVSLRSPLLMPRLALVDPELTHSAPKPVTAASGLDAMTQLVEPYLSRAANPLTDAICLEGLGRAAGALRRAYHDGSDAVAREEMALASLMGGLALANAKLGAVHGIAGPFGGMFDAPHGAICASLLPHVLRANLAALRQRAPMSPSCGRFATVARILCADPTATAEAGIEWIERLTRELEIPTLSQLGLQSDRDREQLIESAMASSSIKGNPIELTRDEMGEIIDWAF
jgi:alcohol dehydrogenase class IV